jgi:hypothetical protein
MSHELRTPLSTQFWGLVSFCIEIPPPRQNNERN